MKTVKAARESGTCQRIIIIVFFLKDKIKKNKKIKLIT